MNTASLAKMLDEWNTHILDWALVLAAIAAITMALLELAKALLLLRPWYHRSRVRAWLREGRQYHELLELSVGGGGTPNALFDQPTNKMMGQIQAAVNAALDFPTKYANLYSFLTSRPGAEGQSNADANTWRAFCAAIEEGKEPTEATAATRARARIEHFVARKLDAFQTVTEYRWARANQAVSVVSASIFLLFLFLSVGPLTPKTIVVAIFGGMISPLAKDVVSALSGLRTRTGS